mgnify:FL=1
MKHRKLLIEIIGWYGVFAVLLAYALTSFSVIVASDLLYSVLNLTGALGIGISTFHKRDYQPPVLNIVWATIAVITLIVSMHSL